jgi:hypothetical protein
VAGPVGYERDQVVRHPDERDDPLGELEVRELRAAADVVEHAGLPVRQHRERGASPVADMKELTTLLARPVHGHGQPLQCADGERRDHALDLPRSVGVRASHHRHVDAVGGAVDAAEQVGGRLAERVRRPGRDRRVL